MIDTKATSPVPAVAATEPSHIHIPRPSRAPHADDRAARLPWAAHVPAQAERPQIVASEA